MGVWAERPETWGGSSQKLGRIDRVWGGRGADRLWGRSTGTHTARQDKTLVTGHFDPLSVRSMNVSPPIRFAPGRIQRFLLFS